MGSPADEADIGGQIRVKVKWIQFHPSEGSKVGVRKDLEFAVLEPLEGEGDYIAIHVLPTTEGDTQYAARYARATGKTAEEATQGLFIGMQKRLHQLRQPGERAPSDHVQEMYLEAVLDMPKGYNPNA